MRAWIVSAAVALLPLASGALAQGTRSTAGAEPREEPAMVNCPSVVGDGVHTMRTYCDVTIGVDPEVGIIVTLPERRGNATLRFDLHNRHIYSEDLVKAKKAYSRYTAGIGVLTIDNHLLTRAAARSEFRTEADLFDRISGGSGPLGMKAVAPLGLEEIAVQIEEMEKQVSILGEKLLVERIDAVENFTTPGRPIALVSNVRVEYVPAPARPAPQRRR